ncbi:phospholipase B1, membrane-associated-like [Megalops cyprinoides]|uniref:phospholipase B1, membrane-associated-like n=1 Tax=Megalops cyprinoides TaxID=118141 RepID=UPI001864E369|nr:phospholipase B1, membrane-associated-like [Megalops cyprinoides]
MGDREAHALRPSDVAVMSAIGLTSSHRNEVSGVLHRLSELLSVFNPALSTLWPDQISSPSSQHRSWSEEAEDLVHRLQANGFNKDWKLLLLLVPVDEICPCPEQARIAVENTVDQVKEVLQTLHRKEARVPTTGQSSESDQVVLELWENLLQPMKGQPGMEGNDIFSTLCPSEDRPFLRTHRNSPLEPQMEVVPPIDSKAASPLFDTIMGSELLCEDRNPSNSPPTTVHALRPADIKVVAALGDSLTAANGVGAAPNNLLDVIREYRGLSWSIGGDKNLTSVTTLPNILREFNPSLTGFSVGISNENSPKAFLNQAVPGSNSDDMPAQVRVLVEKMKTDSRIDFQNDWKVITMFIGGNDLCDHCMDTVYFSPENVVSRIREALDILHKEVPRALVNLVELLHIVPLRRLHQEKSLKCPTWLVKIVCRCVVQPEEGSVELQKLVDLNRAYQRGMRELVDCGRYDTHSNFTVVLQPFFRDVVLPVLEDGRPDRSFFSPDCFHLSQKSHSLMARALWNNMLEPLGNKTHTQDFTVGISLKCPSKSSSFLRTYVNSNYSYPDPPPSPPPNTNWGSDFSCTDLAPSSSVPTSVHRLRPADIKVVASLGDSITTGFGAKSKNLQQLKTEYRGVSWSIGGDKTLKEVTTLPNVLRKFNPSLHGFSKNVGTEQSGFNMAVSGARAFDIPDQARRLIQAMKDSKDVDFENDWKLVTLFIGGNDLCLYCMDRATFSPQNYSYHLRESLDLLYKEVPRVMINIVEILQIEGLRRIKKDTLGCSLLQKNVCPCFLIPGEDSLELSEINRINREYQEETERLVTGGRYDGREDFTVVIQPFFRNTIVPLTLDGKPDLNMFSVDCFHFSERGHSEMAISLWNNMLEPIGRKQSYNNFTHDRHKIRCPTEDQPFIFTRINSRVPSTAVPPVPHCSDSVPVWAAVVFGVAGLLIGWGITWLLLSCRERRKKKKMASVIEMKGNGF